MRTAQSQKSCMSAGMRLRDDFWQFKAGCDTGMVTALLAMGNQA